MFAAIEKSCVPWEGVVLEEKRFDRTRGPHLDFGCCQCRELQYIHTYVYLFIFLFGCRVLMTICYFLSQFRTLEGILRNQPINVFGLSGGAGVRHAP